MKNAEEYLQIKGISLTESLLKLVSDAYAAGACESFNALEAFEHIKEDDIDSAWDKISQIIE